MEQENQENTGENFTERRKEEADRRRSIRDVSLGKELREQKARFERSLEEGERIEGHPHRHRRGTQYVGYIIGAFIAIVFIFGGFLATSFFSRATITITPKTQIISVDEEIVVSENAGNGLALAYEVFSIDETASQVLQGENEEEVERSAVGKITIYNAYGEESQALVTNTRFESENGNIYRIGRSVVVPGIKQNGSPGSLEVTVTSDGAGEEFNLQSGRLTIPGLEGTDLYDSMYAEVTEAITGGFVGIVETVDPEEEETARENNREELTQALEARIVESLPQEYIFVPGSVVFEFMELPNKSTGDSVEVSTRGTLYGVMFKQDVLASYFANEYVSDYSNEPLLFGDPSTLNFELNGGNLELEDIQNEVDFSITGETELVWVVDENVVKETFAGASRGDFQSIASGIRGVQRAQLELVPGFMRSIPDSIEKIEVLVERES
jgi:hypothetical protein